MTLVAIGLDIVEVTRIKDASERFGDRFLKRIFTEAELAYCLAMKRPEPHLAARFAAKEALSKCFGTGIGKEVGWLDLEVGRKESGEPYAILSPKALEFALTKGADGALVSLSHTEHYAAAQAALVCRAVTPFPGQAPTQK